MTTLKQCLIPYVLSNKSKSNSQDKGCTHLLSYQTDNSRSRNKDAKDDTLDGPELSINDTELATNEKPARMRVETLVREGHAAA